MIQTIKIFAYLGIILFFLTAILFPLISDSEKDFLLSVVGPIMMFSAFFASLLSMQNMFKADFQNGTIEQLHIPHSDVFYVREAVQNHYGRPFTLEHVEWAMRMEGWTDE